MAGERRDRRVLRSRRLLQDALVALVQERGYAAVTVQAVLDRADVGRATFYAHFAGKEALLLSIFEELRQPLERELAGITPETVARFGTGVGLLQPLFAHAAQHRRLYRVLLGSRDGAALLRLLREMLATPLRAHLESAIARHRGRPAVEVELVVTAFVSAVLGVLVWWLEADLPGTPAELDRAIERLLAPGIQRALDLSADGAPRRHADAPG
ncbi:MAG TPA: TetR/AcrR family transcriptional regulator [Dehalococcoidia bacterium]|nr:TetR/AcrR family transcriptional regulator [Dehalococcoidia bacterium]